MYTFINSYSLAAASSSFTWTGFSSNTDYSEIHFYFSNIHVTSSNTDFEFQVNATGEIGFNETMTSNFCYFAYNTEDSPGSDGGPGLGGGQAGGTAFNPMAQANLNTDTDSSNNGYMVLYNPSETTHHKLWKSSISTTSNSAKAELMVSHGVIDTASNKAIDSIQFKCTSGNMDDGDILVYGVS